MTKLYSELVRFILINNDYLITNFTVDMTKKECLNFFYFYIQRFGKNQLREKKMIVCILHI